MTSDEIRTAFLEFFESKEHKVVPSSSLIPHGDPTLLLTTAGMVQMKPYFLGETVSPALRLASSQKCFRTTDIELVGDPTHLTFFEMLGNFSIGDYFKKEAIAWAWEFVTERLEIPRERLWATIFLDDDEAFQHWRETGLSEERILRFGEAENFWGPAGGSGPCGPCSEIFYDFGEEVGCGESSCAPNCDCARFTEIWNLVFIQFDQDKDGNRTLLPKPSIDTGMGLERMTTLLQGKTSIYETELFALLIDNISRFVGKNYGSNDETDQAMRVIVEHGRALTFLIADGVMPGNEGRGYVLRRLLRRAVLYSRGLGSDRSLLTETAGTVIGQMEHVYLELAQRGDFILKVIQLEEDGFAETLNTGLELLGGLMEQAAGKNVDTISAEEAFKLSDTYGFPIELTSEIASGRGFSVDLAGFEREMEKQRVRAKAAQKFAPSESAALNNTLDIKGTIFTGYTSLKEKTSILSLLVGNDSVGTVEMGQEAGLILVDTPFYGEMGGQVGDIGEISTPAAHFSVIDTIRIPPDIIVHRGRVTKGSFSVGVEVEVEVDRENRFDIARNHTATHLLQAALRQVLGEHIQQKGSLVAADRFRFDFSHLAAMTKEEIAEVQWVVNDRVRQNLAVSDEDIPYRKAIEEGAIAFFDEKYAEVVRVLKIGRPLFSAELCGGTHVNSTGEIGSFHIISESSIGAGLRRIEAVTGRGAEEHIGRRLLDLEKIAKYLDSETEDVANQAQNLSAELKNERRQRLALEKQLARGEAESLERKIREVGGINVLVERVAPTSIDNLREMSDSLRDKMKNGMVALVTVYEDKPVFVVNVSPDLVAKGYKAGEIVKRAAGITGGSGGGRPNLAQGGGTDKTKLDEALKEVEKYIEELGSS
ncbi:MAG: alanine--tRNA ligase [Dehalococcoidales bacterium]|nr:alanine--tRNA ligase [Dehalococcoidales bacterium]